MLLGAYRREKGRAADGLIGQLRKAKIELRYPAPVSPGSHSPSLSELLANPGIEGLGEPPDDFSSKPLEMQVLVRLEHLIASADKFALAPQQATATSGTPSGHREGAINDN